MYLAGTLDITHEQGTYFYRKITWSGHNLYGWTVTFKIYQNTKTVLLKSNIIPGVPTTEDMEIILTGTETNLTKKTYKYQIDVVDQQGNTYRLLKGLFKII